MHKTESIGIVHKIINNDWNGTTQSPEMVNIIRHYQTPLLSGIGRGKPMGKPIYRCFCLNASNDNCLGLNVSEIGAASVSLDW